MVWLAHSFVTCTLTDLSDCCTLLPTFGDCDGQCQPGHDQEEEEEHHEGQSVFVAVQGGGGGQV